MKKNLQLLIFGITIIMASTQTVNSAISHADSLNFLNQQIATLDERDLVVFDMDDVLIVAEDAILHRNAAQLYKRIYDQYSQTLTNEQKSHFFSYIWKHAKTRLVDPQIVPLIASLQKRSVKVIVLTAAQIGRVGIIEDTAAFRVLELGLKGIDLQESFPELKPFTLEEFSNESSPPPIFCKGVILSDRYPKGDVLAAFLKKIAWKPRSLIFIDDLLFNHESVEKIGSQIKIENLQCWHYTATEKLAREIDLEVAHLQMRTLIEKGQWLSDEESRKILSDPISY